MSTFPCNPERWEEHYLQNLLFNPIYSWGGGLWTNRKLGVKKGLLYNLQSVSRVTQQHYNPLHPRWFRSYIQKPEEKMDDQPVPSIVLYGRRQAQCKERINQSPLPQSLSYQKAAGWESGARKRHITTSPMSHALVPCSLLLTHTCTQTPHTQLIHIYRPSIHAHTHSHTCIDNIHAEIEPLSVYWRGGDGQRQLACQMSDKTRFME